MDELLNTFIEEAREHLSTIESGLLELETNPEDEQRINRLFRSVHTIKGGAGFLGLNKVSQLAHNMENLLSLARSNEISLKKAHIDALLSGYDLLALMIDDPQNSENVEISEVYRTLEELRTSPPETQKSIEKQAIENLNGVASIQIEEDDNEEGIEELSTPNFYEIHIFLNQDLAPFKKSLPHYLDELKKYGQLLDSYWDIENRVMENGHITGNLSFVFLFSSDMALDSLQKTLQLPSSRIIPTETAEFRKFQEKQSIEEHSNNEKYSSVNTDKTDEIEKPLVIKPKKSQAKKAGKNSLSLKPQESHDSHHNDSEQNHKESETEESIRVHVKRLNKLINLAGELVLIRNQILRNGEQFTTQNSGLKPILQNFNRVTTEIQEEIMNTRMQPIGNVFGKFPRLVRQLASELGKQVDLTSEGGDVELDKTIIEALTDPMTHIIRNTLDHGIESPAERQSKGKSPTGTVIQRAFHESGQVIIQVIDDGRGVNPEKIVSKAIEKGMVSEESAQRMSDSEKINLIFLAGLSTAETVSAVSGRGVGMDVVKNSIEQIGGSVDLSSILDRGTTLTMTLPLTMAIVSCLIVETRECRFAFPQVNLEEMVMLQSENYGMKIGHVQNQAVLRLRGKLLPLISLEEGLYFSEKSTGKQDKILSLWNREKQDFMNILVVKSGIHRVGIVVDKVLGSEEIVVKPMPEYLKHIRSFSGTTILGDGTIAMIMDVPGFIEKNQLIASEEDIKRSNLIQEVTQTMIERESFLIFDNGTDENFALALPWIRRVDSLDVNKIQRIGTREYIEYRGEQMRLLRLENYLPIQRPEHQTEKAHIIIPKYAKIPVGLLINRVIDTKTVEASLEKIHIEGRGILGSILLDGRITLILNLYAILEMGEPASVEMRLTYRAKDKHVLLVEDTPFFMKVVKECLTSAEYQVTTAINGQEALNTLQNQTFDLVLTDIEMPIMDGRELVKRIRSYKKWDKLPVIALTALADEKSMTEGRQCGFAEWLVKLDKEKLLNTISEYLH